MQTLMRTLVMLVALAVGGLAIIAYGPAERVRPVVQRVTGLIDDLRARLRGPSPAPPQTVIATPPLAEQNEPLRLDPLPSPPAPATTDESRSAETLAPQEPPSALSKLGGLMAQIKPPAPPEREEGDPLAPLAELGAADTRLEAWGSEGRLQRCSCTVAWNEQAGFARHFEAVASTADEAVRQVAAEIAAWQAERGLAQRL